MMESGLSLLAPLVRRISVPSPSAARMLSARRASAHTVRWLTAAELFYDRGNRYDFVSLSQELAGPGEMRQAQTFDFTFKNVEKQYESYSGINVKLRYLNLLT